MRAWVALIAFLGLLGALALAVFPVLHRPPLRVAVSLTAENADHAALAAGVERALEERDHRAGRWRVSTANQIHYPKSHTEIPKPCAHTMLPGPRAPASYSGADGPLLPVYGERMQAVIRTWMRGRGLERLVEDDRSSNRSRFRPAAEEGKWAAVLEQRPDVVLLTVDWSFDEEILRSLREAGFQGPVFIVAHWFFWMTPDTTDKAFYVLAPCKPPPPEFPLRHPFAYLGYRRALRYLDAVDANPQADPIQVARELDRLGELVPDLEEPRVYEALGGRLVAAP